MRIDSVSFTRSNAVYSKQNRTARKENNVSFTHLNMRKGVMALPLLAALTFTENTSARQIQNDTTKVEVVSQKRTSQQNTNNEELNENLSISDFSPKVQQFIQDNNINTDGNNEISIQELWILYNAAKYKAYDNVSNGAITFNTQSEAVSYLNNVDDVALAASKITNGRFSDKKFFNKQIGYMNNVLSILDEKYSIICDKDKQVAKIDSLGGVIENLCNEFINTNGKRCIKLDDALFNMETSFQSSDTPTSRDDYNFSYSLFQKTASGINADLNYFKVVLKRIQEDIMQDCPEVAYERTIKLKDEFNITRDFLKDEQAKIQKQSVLKSQQYLDNNKNGELNDQQLNSIGEVFKSLAEFRKGRDEDQEQINEHIENYNKMREPLATYAYRPDLGPLMKMHKELVDNYSDFYSRYDKTIQSYENFGYENTENLQNAIADRNTESNRYNAMTEAFEAEIDNLRKMYNDVQNPQDESYYKIYCNNMLEALIKTRKANDQAMRKLEIGAIEFLVNVVDVRPTTNAKAIIKNNTPDTKTKKVIEDGEIIIKRPVKDTNGNIVIQNNSLDGKPVKSDKH